MFTCNPWFAIALSDYEGHMAWPGIEQAQMLNAILADVLDQHVPQSLAVLGCAGGNGFASISPAITRRVVGVDLNPDYLAQARARYAGRFASLELHAADLQQTLPPIEPVDLVFAALILEYVDVEIFMARTRCLLGPHGKLVTVIQLPSASSAKVTASPFASLGLLADVMHLVPPRRVLEAALTQGHLELESRTVTSAGGKQFQVQVFSTAAPRIT